MTPNYLLDTLLGGANVIAENHHIYKDETGFPYDVMLTKIDTRNNKNERVAITVSQFPGEISSASAAEELKIRVQLYESNAQPHTYSTNVNFRGTGRKPVNNIMVSIGSPFPPAFRTFKTVFREKSGVEWDNRIEHHFARNKDEKRGVYAGQTTGSEDRGSRQGTAVDSQAAGETETEEDKKKREDEEFNKMSFEYHPPQYGPKGKLPKDKAFPDLVNASNRTVDHWMSGGKGAGPGPNQTVDLKEDDEVEDLTTTAVNENGTAAGNGDFEALLPQDSATEDANATRSILDKDITYWVDNNIDNHYPFDHTAANIEYINSTNDQLESTEDQLPTVDTINTNTFTQIEEMMKNVDKGAGQQVSFDNVDTNVAEPPISFNLPSTVPETDSFAQGTQDVSDTQMADRVQGEFEEFINVPSTEDCVTGANESSDIDGFVNINTPSSVLGKRKATPDVEAIVYGVEQKAISPKKGKLTFHGHEHEVFALTAEQCFEDDQALGLATGGNDLSSGYDLDFFNDFAADFGGETGDAAVDGMETEFPGRA